MRKTRAEILIELRYRLGQSENTEHLIDWLLDIWETRDILLRLLGREYTNAIIEAVGPSAPDIRPHECALCDLVLEDIHASLLN